MALRLEPTNDRRDGPRWTVGWRDDERGQMMLLTAIVLLIGFIALAGMVSRVSLLAQQAGREQDRALLREIEPLQKGLNAALDPSTAANAKGLGKAGLTAGTAAYESGVKSVLESLRQLEGARGFIARWTIDCGLTGAAKDPLKGFATFTLSDGELQVTLTSVTFTRPSCAVVLQG